MVEDKTGLRCFTRYGGFEVTKDGYLRNSHLHKDLVTIVNGTKLTRLKLQNVAKLNGSNLISLRIGLDGLILGIYESGSSRKLGRIALALFQNQRKLERLKGHCLQPTNESGDPYIDFAQIDGRGSIYSSTLEAIDEKVYEAALDSPQEIQD